MILLKFSIIEIIAILTYSTFFNNKLVIRANYIFCLDCLFFIQLNINILLLTSINKIKIIFVIFYFSDNLNNYKNTKGIIDIFNFIKNLNLNFNIKSIFIALFLLKSLNNNINYNHILQKSDFFLYVVQILIY